MIHKADVAYLALGDYRNGACAWRTGQFVLITEPEEEAALEAEGAMDLLQRLDREAFLGQGAGSVATAASPAPEASAAEADEVEGPAAEVAAGEAAEGITVAAGKQRGRNRMRTGGQDR